MKAPITSAQAMRHPTVTETINTLGKMCDELRTERDALQGWKRAAEYWYMECRHMKYGKDECLVEGVLDAWFNGTWKAISMKGTP